MRKRFNNMEQCEHQFIKLVNIVKAWTLLTFTREESIACIKCGKIIS